MPDPHGAMLHSLCKFLLSLLVPGGGQLFLGQVALGAAIYALVVGALALVTRNVVQGAWAGAALLTVAALVYAAGIVGAGRTYYATLTWYDRPWPVVLVGLVVLLGFMLWLVVPRPGSS